MIPTADTGRLIRSARRRLARRAAPVVDGLTRTVIADQLGREDVAGLDFVDETAAELLKKLTGMPAYLSLAMLGTTVAFDQSARVRGGRRFRSLDHAERMAWLDLWRAAPVGVFRDFVAFYEKMGVFVYYTHIEEAEHG